MRSIRFEITLSPNNLFISVILVIFLLNESLLTLRRTRKFTPPPPTVVQGEGRVGWMDLLPGVFDMLQYFEAILPLMKSL